jgi:hypothetical protein
MGWSENAPKGRGFEKRFYKFEASVKILISPLDWGLGHATRLIPIIKEQLDNAHEVTLAACREQASILREHFPGLEIIDDIPAYSPVYYSNLPMSLGMLIQLPNFLSAALRERNWLIDLQKRRKFDRIISDHRLGLCIPEIHCALVIHQICIESPWFISPMLRWWQSKWIERFDECYIPDYSCRKLSGNLSRHQHLKIPVRFVGPLSRFHRPVGNTGEILYEWLVIASGPEPARGKFIMRLKNILMNKSYKSIIICGDPVNQQRKVFGNVELVSHLNDDELIQMISHSAHIVCRSGYSTLSDLEIIQRRALLVPTPGQTEQEYLASYHAKSKIHDFCEEKNLIEYFSNR